MIRPMTSNVSALSSVVAKSHQPSTSFPPPPLFIPYGGVSLSTAGSQPGPPAPFRNLAGLRLTPELPFVRFRLMVHPPAIGAFVYSVETRLFRTCLSLVSERGHFRGGSFLVMLRPARWLGRLTSPRRPLLQSPTGPPVYGRACPSRGLPQPESAITTRPNHLLPRRDSHPLACQRSKAAHRNLLFGAPACT